MSSLRQAEAYLAGQKYREAFTAAKAAAGMLGGYVKSSWWLSLCHETAARSYALIGNAEAARRELVFARRHWDDSQHDDIVRECEFTFTEGLIAWKQDSCAEAVHLFELSTNFAVNCPCIKAIHLEYLSQALVRDQQTERAMVTLQQFFRVEIEW